MALHTHPYIKKIAASAYPSRDKEQKHLKFQAGLTLIELMIGLAVGLLVVAVATVSLLGSRSVTGAVSDISGIQQQAAYVMRTFGTQLRQAGSLYLDLGLDADGKGEITSATAFQLRGNNEQAINEDAEETPTPLRLPEAPQAGLDSDLDPGRHARCVDGSAARHLPGDPRRLTAVMVQQGEQVPPRIQRHTGDGLVERA